MILYLLNIIIGHSGNLHVTVFHFCLLFLVLLSEATLPNTSRGDIFHFGGKTLEAGQLLLIGIGQLYKQNCRDCQ